MNSKTWLSEMQALYAVQQKPAWLPSFLWLSAQQRSKILRELLQPQQEKV